MTDKKQDNSTESVRIPYQEMKDEYYRVLTKIGFISEKAEACAKVFTENSVDGVYTHGVNRFPRFVQYIKDQYILPDAEPELISASGCMEQWDGRIGPGPINALHSTERAMELARKNGMGCVALRNTNHWMRGGLYGWKAAKAGFVFIGWTNTIANMPAWKAADNRLGNNPLVIAVPFEDECIVLDMAMSQYSFGAIELHKMKNQMLDVPGGYDMQGNMTTDPRQILESEKGLPIGYWKGAGLSLLLDILATILSGGNSTSEITRKGTEYSVSQVFIAIDISALSNYQTIQFSINQIIDDYKNSLPFSDNDKIVYPGERVLTTRKENLEKGIPVMTKIWNSIKDL